MENISNIIVAVAAVFGAITAALVGGITVWAFRDIRSRSRDILVQILATVLVAVIPIAGLIVYLLLRPRETLQEGYVRALEEESLLSSIEHQEFCPTCGRRVNEDFQFCPSCHTKLRNPCHSCGKAIHLSWGMCPYCGVETTPEMPQTRVTKPQPQRVGTPSVKPAAKVAAPQRSMPAPSLPSAQAAKAKLGSLLDRVGGAVDNVAAKAQQRIAPANDDDTPAEIQRDAPTPAPTSPYRTRPINNSSFVNGGAATPRTTQKLDEDELE